MRKAGRRGKLGMPEKVRMLEKVGMLVWKKTRQ
jgi:hypothetical protein